MGNSTVTRAYRRHLQRRISVVLGSISNAACRPGCCLEQQPRGDHRQPAAWLAWLSLRNPSYAPPTISPSHTLLIVRMVSMLCSGGPGEVDQIDRRATNVGQVHPLAVDHHRRRRDPAGLVGSGVKPTIAPSPLVISAGRTRNRPPAGDWPVRSNGRRPRERFGCRSRTR